MGENHIKFANGYLKSFPGTEAAGGRLLLVSTLQRTLVEHEMRTAAVKLNRVHVYACAGPLELWGGSKTVMYVAVCEIALVPP